MMKSAVFLSVLVAVVNSDGDGNFLIVGKGAIITKIADSDYYITRHVKVRVGPYHCNRTWIIYPIGKIEPQFRHHLQWMPGLIRCRMETKCNNRKCECPTDEYQLQSGYHYKSYYGEPNRYGCCLGHRFGWRARH